MNRVGRQYRRSIGRSTGSTGGFSPYRRFRRKKYDMGGQKTLNNDVWLLQKERKYSLNYLPAACLMIININHTIEWLIDTMMKNEAYCLFQVVQEE